MSKNKKKILIVDDQPLLRHGLSQLIAKEVDLDVCGETSNHDDALALLAKKSPDLIVLDVTLADKHLTGVDLIRHIRQQNTEVRVLVLSMHEEKLYAERAMRAGANGYIMKQESPDKVIAGIRKVLGGEIVLSPVMAQTLLRRCLADENYGREPDVNRLSSREYEVLRLVGEGHSPQQIGEKMSINTKTVETHRFNIRKKMHLANAAELARFAAAYLRGETGK